jgi:polysaccharide export outer membrane protein
MIIKNKYKLFLFMGTLIFLSSCKVIAPNRMFKQGDYQYFSVGKEVIDQYTIQEGDLLTLQIYSREGFQLIDVLPNETGGGSNVNSGQGGQNSSGGGSSGNSQNMISYLVEQDGYVELPLFGRTYAKGLTENQLEDLIEEKCSAIFVEPYAILKVINRRAFVFKGSEAAVVSLNQGPTSLIEVITKAGGIGTDLKAYKIRIIRGDLSNPEIIEVDLSTIQGLQNANLIVQTNDIVYIEQRIRYVSLGLREITPIVSVVGTVTTVMLLIKR